VRTRSERVDRLVRSGFQLLMSVHDLDCKVCPAKRDCGLRTVSRSCPRKCTLRSTSTCALSIPLPYRSSDTPQAAGCLKGTVNSDRLGRQLIKPSPRLRILLRRVWKPCSRGLHLRSAPGYLPGAAPRRLQLPAAQQRAESSYCAAVAAVGNLQRLPRFGGRGCLRPSSAAVQPGVRTRIVRTTDRS
jgi:hypothetical protein